MTEKYSCTAGKTTLGWLWLGWCESAGQRALIMSALGDELNMLEQESAERFQHVTGFYPHSSSCPSLFNAVAGLLTEPELTARFLAKHELQLNIKGTEFQQQVWAAIAQIAPGHTLTYGALARTLGKSRAVRAVASACAANPLALVIPCHRVVAADGGLSGYRWGIERKRLLLQGEGATGFSL